jgi:hypothetical protein
MKQNLDELIEAVSVCSKLRPRATVLLAALKALPSEGTLVTTLLSIVWILQMIGKLPLSTDWDEGK